MTTTDQAMKHCPACKESRPVTEFGQSARRKDGLQPYCRDHAREHRSRSRTRQRKARVSVGEQRERQFRTDCRRRLPNVGQFPNKDLVTVWAAQGGKARL